MIGSNETNQLLQDVTMYRCIIESLIYMTIMRQDLSYVMGLVNQFMQAPRKPHLNAARCILRYVKSTLHYRIFYEAGRPIEIYGYTNANQASSISDIRSTNGFMFSLGSGTIRWSNNKKHTTTTLSSKEAEYRGATMATCEVDWLWNLLDDMGQSVLITHVSWQNQAH